MNRVVIALILILGFTFSQAKNILDFVSGNENYSTFYNLITEAG